MSYQCLFEVFYLQILKFMVEELKLEILIMSADFSSVEFFMLWANNTLDQLASNQITSAELILYFNFYSL